MATTAGLVAATLITACVVPQVVAVIRSPDPAGVSSTAAGQASLSCAAWTAYALSAEMSIAVWSSGSGAVLWGVVAIVAAVRSGSWPSPAAATCSLLVVALASTAGLAALGTLLLTEALATTLPQASRARKEVRGLAMSTYLMMCAGASCWVIYGAGAGDWPLSASSLLKATVCAYIVLHVRARHRRQGTAQDATGLHRHCRQAPQSSCGPDAPIGVARRSGQRTSGPVRRRGCAALPARRRTDVSPRGCQEGREAQSHCEHGVRACRWRSPLPSAQGGHHASDLGLRRPVG